MLSCNFLSPALFNFYFFLSEEEKLKTMFSFWLHFCFMFVVVGVFFSPSRKYFRTVMSSL